MALSDKDQERMKELTVKQQEGSLTPEEQAELNQLKQDGAAEDALETSDEERTGFTTDRSKMEHEKNKRNQ